MFTVPIDNFTNSAKSTFLKGLLKHFQIVDFVGEANYASQAIKFSALDYLLKPVKHEELYKAIQKATKRKDNKQTQEQIHNLLSVLDLTKKSITLRYL